ncbi:hypothetical protein L1987_58419 [Smallanthus sonchifolius]|uniref:Uncharacterized protein n=1 Tax=Smallanthus sonchifolius TaxID=185202 RepID=A0ACB9DG18_9ASTR|nr:hypothetical protein L1987_58419 [Smallanthus sonchifolius]
MEEEEESSESVEEEESIGGLSMQDEDDMNIEQMLKDGEQVNEKEVDSDPFCLAETINNVMGIKDPVEDEVILPAVEGETVSSSWSRPPDMGRILGFEMKGTKNDLKLLINGMGEKMVDQ